MHKSCNGKEMSDMCDTNEKKKRKAGETIEVSEHRIKGIPLLT